MDAFDLRAWSGIITALLIGIAAIVGAFARPLFQNLFTSKPYCHMNEAAQHHIADLHDWHGPDHQGEQGWRGHGIERRLASMEETQAKGFEDMRNGQTKVSGLLRELITVTQRK
jgi:hypothetical protein